MKYYLILFLTLACVFSCKKQSTIPTRDKDAKEKLERQIRDSVLPLEFQKLDFSKAILNYVSTGSIKLLRIPFKGVPMDSKFLLVQMDKAGTLLQGRVINVVRHNEKKGWKPFSGIMTIESLGGRLLEKLPIIEGFFKSKNANSEVTSMQGAETNEDAVPGQYPYGTLPEFVVVGYISSSGGISYSDYFSLINILNYGSNYYSNSGYYNVVDALNSGGDGSIGLVTGPGSHTTSGSSNSDLWQVASDNSILIDFEFTENLAPIELDKYIKCFNNIPDNGAVCSIELFTDIPVDGDPNVLFNWSTNSPGHTFLQIKKSNGSQSAIQNIGFYPAQGWKTILTPAPVKGKFADNSQHEFNASLKMTIPPENLQKILDHISYLSKYIKYDIDEYNCTDFALDVFNYVRNNPIEIPKFDIPGGMAINGTSTPQGLYKKLYNMYQTGDLEASNITIPGFKGWVASSSGPCY